MSDVCCAMLRFCFVVFALSATSARAEPVNAVLGDASWEALRSGPPRGEVERIQVHLEYVETRLRAVDGGGEVGARRRAALDHLAGYRRAGVFPRRTEDAFPGRRPRFIDDRGTHCAVGELMRATGYGALAARVDATQEYAYVKDLEDPEVRAWARRFGFTLEELAMIQPSYAPPLGRDDIEEGIRGAVDAITLACAKDHDVDGRFLLRVRRARGGDVRVRPRRFAGGFARCFAEKAARSVRHGGAWDQEPWRVRLRMVIRPRDPEEILRERLAALRFEGRSTTCLPRPGPTPDRAAIAVRVGAEGLQVEVDSAPRNEEVDACLEQHVAQRLSQFEAGRWSLSASREVTLGRAMSEEALARQLEHVAGRYASECDGEGAVRVVVVARVDEALRIDTEGGTPEFRECWEAALRERLRSDFSVGRRVGGVHERYFRVDAPARAEAELEVEPLAEREARLAAEREAMEREMERQRRYH